MTITFKLPLTLKIYFYEHMCQNITWSPPPTVPAMFRSSLLVKGKSNSVFLGKKERMLKIE